MSSSAVVCGERAAECVCGLSPGHDGPHECLRSNCGGQWKGSYLGGDFDPVRFPSMIEPDAVTP